ncbi:unnamed protein product [Ectocarpus sp. CCAP 1310/34]|nr:unnamed protein product [Ectocarpus sp. CCAP 1310/34]
MGLGEDEFLVPSGLMMGGSSRESLRSHHQHQHQQPPGLWKLTRPLLVALGVFGVSTGAARYLFPRRKLQPQREQLERLVAVRTGNSAVTSECATASKVVMEGADLTRYFSLELGAAAVYGVEEYEALYNGYRFWFESAENKAMFEESPKSYIPQWGGFCSWGISREDWWTADELGPPADPNQWLITNDGGLHFFRSELPMSKFLGDVPGNIVAGNQIWHSWWGDVEPAADGAGSPLDTDCFCSTATCEDA